MKCDSCGAPVENGKCTYCGKEFKNNGNEQSFRENRRTERVYIQPKSPFWKQTWFIVLMCILLPPVGIVLLWLAKKPANKTTRLIITVILVLYTIAAMFGRQGDESEHESRNQTKTPSVWLEGYTDIDDFEYYIDGNEIFLTDFHSSEKKVRINSSYEIDGVMYNVVSLDEVFTLDRVTSVIIPEGVRSVAINEFNSCGIEFLYLPSTLQDVGGDYFWHYFHDVEKIYYGGTEEQWNQLCTVERSEIEAKQIIFNTNPDDLK